MLFLAPIGFTLVQTLAAAVASVAVGVAAKSIYDECTDRDDEAFNRGQAAGEQRAKAAHEEKLRRLTQAMETHMAKSKNYFDVILAVMTVGYAHAAACNGRVSHVQRTEITEFVIGQSLCYLPPNLQQMLNAIATTPPNLSTAYAAVMQLAPGALPICDLLIDILDANPSTSHGNRKQASVWAQLKAA